MTEKQKARVLDWPNRVRKEKKLGPPLKQLKKGDVEDGYSCPLACSLLSQRRSVFVCVDHVMWDEGTDDCERISPPEYIRNFIQEFDDGDIPELQR